MARDQAQELQIKGGKGLGRVSIPTVVDSGSTDLEVPSRMHGKIMKALGRVASGHGIDLSDELLKIPDDLIASFSTFQVVIENTEGRTITLDVAPETYFQKVSTVGYLLRIRVREDQLILGQTFMKNYRVVFDRPGASGSAWARTPAAPSAPRREAPRPAGAGRGSRIGGATGRRR